MFEYSDEYEESFENEVVDEICYIEKEIEHLEKQVRNAMWFEDLVSLAQEIQFHNIRLCELRSILDRMEVKA